MAEVTRVQWEEFVKRLPDVHVLQQGAWGDLKAGFGWAVTWVVSGETGAQILFRKLPLGFSIGYIPKGPLGRDARVDFWQEVDRACRKRRCIFLKVEPDGWENGNLPGLAKSHGFIPSSPIQPRRTVEIDLNGGEDLWLERMKQKTRYNIRLAQKKDVKISETTDINAFHELMQVTGKRDGFGVHSLSYYRNAYQLFHDRGDCAILQAYFEDRPLAALMVFRSGSRAWYFYGASNDEERNRMPTYLLQWEAMRWAAARGCRTYDLWGIPDEEENVLEADFSSRSDGLWGVYRFKRGFGGEIKRSAGAWDRVYMPVYYKAYQWYARRMGREV